MLTNIKCELQELFGGGKIDIDFNKINIYVGQNGTGKTVLLKLAWFGTYITSNKILEERGFLPQNCIQEDFVNHTISKVFDEVDFNGKMVFTFENNLTTTLIFEKGICIDITFSNLTKDKNILDIACGSGFGSYIIATDGKAKQVIGVDLDNDAIRYANHKFHHDNIKRFVGDAVKFKYKEKFDIIISFETI